MNSKTLDFLKKLQETPSPSGSEVAIAELVRDRLGDSADEISTDVMGSVHATIYGKEETREVVPSVMLAAHMDEIGLMVRYISPEGFLSVAQVGGVDSAILPGLRVDVHTESGILRGVVGRKPIHLLKPEERKVVTPLEELVIDLGLPAKVVSRKVSIGDCITFGVGFETFGKDMAVSRAFDDKIGVFVGIRVLETLKREGRAPGDYIFAGTVQEELGTRGAITTSYSVCPKIGLAIDVCHATDYPGIAKTVHGDCACGRGPVIAVGPNINQLVHKKLVNTAKKYKIPYQIGPEPGVTGTDARSIQVTKDGIATGLISVPLRYMHTPTEVLDLNDITNTIKLIACFIKDLDDRDSFVPGFLKKQ